IIDRRPAESIISLYRHHIFPERTCLPGHCLNGPAKTIHVLRYLLAIVRVGQCVGASRIGDSRLGDIHRPDIVPVRSNRSNHNGGLRSIHGVSSTYTHYPKIGVRREHSRNIAKPAYSTNDCPVLIVMVALPDILIAPGTVPTASRTTGQRAGISA